jgi:hypothetical protein
MSRVGSECQFVSKLLLQSTRLVLCVYFEEYTNPEASALLGIPLRTIERRLPKILQQLRDIWPDGQTYFPPKNKPQPQISEEKPAKTPNVKRQRKSSDEQHRKAEKLALHYRHQHPPEVSRFLYEMYFDYLVAGGKIARLPPSYARED